MLERLKNLNIDRIDLDEAVALVAIGKMAQTTYAGFEVPAPRWLGESLETLSDEIRRRRREMLVARQRELAAQVSTLKSREERRADAEAELARINAQLAGTPPTSGQANG